MASRRLVPASLREALLGIPSDIASLERNYLLADDDLDLIGTRRHPENRLGLALHIALLRHPGQGWHDDTEPPAPLVAWLAVRHLGLRAFVPAHDMRTAMDLAARAAFDIDDGRIILARLSGEIKAQRFVLPSADTLERIGLAGRSRRLSAQALNDALGDERKKALEALFGGAIDAMVRACEYDRDPFDVLDEEIGWDRLVASREEIAALGDLATQDPLSLATQRYAQLRRFAPGVPGGLRVRRPRLGPRPAGRRDSPQGAQPHGQTPPSGEAVGRRRPAASTRSGSRGSSIDAALRGDRSSVVSTRQLHPRSARS